jgi:Lon-like protease
VSARREHFVATQGRTAVALFTDDRTTPTRRATPAVRAGWIALCVALAIALILTVAPAPYVIEKPGPAFNTLGTSAAIGTEEAASDRTPLISISGQTVYPTKGSLDLLTVSMLGNPDNLPKWLTVITAWMDPSEAVIPVDAAFPKGVSTKQQEQQNQAAMVNSQQDAIAAALTRLGYAYPTTVSVVSLPENSPAKGVVKPGDEVVSVNGAPVDGLAGLRAALQANGAGTEATLGILRGGEERSVAVTPVKAGNAVVVGMNVKTEYRFPFKVTIQLDKVGGPSAGMMFALGIIDKLTPGAIQGGADVAGTGTIDQAGTVGAIGGIRQKLYGARESGAEWFLAPAANCAEVAGHVPDGLSVISVKTLDDSLAALDAIRTGEGTKSLPTCTAG